MFGKFAVAALAVVSLTVACTAQVATVEEQEEIGQSTEAVSVPTFPHCPFNPVNAPNMSDVSVEGNPNKPLWGWMYQNCPNKNTTDTFANTGIEKQLRDAGCHYKTRIYHETQPGSKCNAWWFAAYCPDTALVKSIQDQHQGQGYIWAQSGPVECTQNYWYNGTNRLQKNDNPLTAGGHRVVRWDPSDGSSPVLAAGVSADRFVADGWGRCPAGHTNATCMLKSSSFGSFDNSRHCQANRLCL